MSLTKVVRVNAFFSKKQGMSDEEFKDFYINVHAAHLIPKMKEYGIISYSQQFITPESTAKLAHAAGRPAPILDYSVMGSIVFPSWEAVEKWFKDEGNAKHQAEDGPQFADYSNLRFVCGEEYVVMQDGKPMV